MRLRYAFVRYREIKAAVGRMGVAIAAIRTGFESCSIGESEDELEMLQQAHNRKVAASNPAPETTETPKNIDVFRGFDS